MVASVTSNPVTVQTFLLVARRFLLGAPKLRHVGVGGLNSYELDAIAPPPDFGVPRRPKRRTLPTTTMITPTKILGSSFSIQQQQQQQRQQQQSSQPIVRGLPPMDYNPTGRNDEIEPYSLEPIHYEPDGRPRTPVPYWYDSPHWRPDV